MARHSATIKYVMTRAKYHPERGMVRGRTLVLLVAAVVMLVGGWIGFSLLSNGQPSQNTSNDARKTADNFVAMLADKNTETTYDSLSAKYKETTPKDEWKEWVEIAFGDLEGKPSFDKELPIQQAGDIYGKDTTPTRYVYSFNVRGKFYKVPFVFIKEGGSWKLAEIGSPIE